MMRTPRVRLLTFFLLSCLLPLLAVAQGEIKLETTGPLQNAAVSSEIRTALQSQGQRVLLRNGDPLCELWLASSLPKVQPKEGEGAYSTVLTPGEFVGVITYLKPGKDFRGQPIAAGTYTLRYELMPNDGNHMGVAPQRDFLLLSAVARDSSTATIASGTLLEASSAAAGTNHPAVLLMLPPPKAPLPRAYEAPEGYVAFGGKAGDHSLAIVVKGQAEQ